MCVLAFLCVLQNTVSVCSVMWEKIVPCECTLQNSTPFCWGKKLWGCHWLKYVWGFSTLLYFTNVRESRRQQRSHLLMSCFWFQALVPGFVPFWKWKWTPLCTKPVRKAVEFGTGILAFRAGYRMFSLIDHSVWFSWTQVFHCNVTLHVYTLSFRRFWKFHCGWKAVFLSLCMALSIIVCSNLHGDPVFVSRQIWKCCWKEKMLRTDPESLVVQIPENMYNRHPFATCWPEEPRPRVCMSWRTRYIPFYIFAFCVFCFSAFYIF